MKKYLSAFVCGFGAGVLQVVPIVKQFQFCLIIPGAAVIAVFLYQKSNRLKGFITNSKAVIVGLLTGLFAAAFSISFDLLITLITKTNDFVEFFPATIEVLNQLELPKNLHDQVYAMFESMKSDITENGFSAIYTLSIIAQALIVNPIFGLLGGLLGMQIYNTKIQKTS